MRHSANESAHEVFSTRVITVFPTMCVCVTCVCLVCDLLVLLMRKSKALWLPTQASHIGAHARVGWNCVSVMCLCKWMCVVLWWRAALVTCGDLNEVNNLLHLFHLPPSSYYTHTFVVRGLLATTTLSYALLSHQFPSLPYCEGCTYDYICAARGAVVSFCALRVMQHSSDCTVAM